MKNQLLPVLLLLGCLAEAQTCLAQSATGANEPCSTNWCEVVKGPTGSITFTNVALSPLSPMCFGSWVSAWAEADTRCSEVITASRWSIETTNCPTTRSTNTSCPYFTTNWWVVSSPGYSGTGEGTSVSFFPTNCGAGTITFSGVWKNTDPCTGLPIGGGTSTISTNFKVIRVEITPPSSNALINKCQDPNRKVQYCLTNSCIPGGVTWSLTPIIPNGASLEGSGGCVSVKIGDVVADYTVTATSNDNTNCVASASLSVGRDCDCSHHLIGPNGVSQNQTGGDISCGGGVAWLLPPLTNTCGETVQVGCDGTDVRLTGSISGDCLGHCPYLPTAISAVVFQCKFNEVFMKTIFQVEERPPGSLGRGKIETWLCGSGYSASCYCRNASGVATNRPCDITIDGLCQ